MSKMKDALYVQEILTGETDFRGAVDYIGGQIGEQATEIYNELRANGIAPEEISVAMRELMEHDLHGVVGRELLDNIAFQAEMEF